MMDRKEEINRERERERGCDKEDCRCWRGPLAGSSTIGSGSLAVVMGIRESWREEERERKREKEKKKEIKEKKVRRKEIQPKKGVTIGRQWRRWK